VFDVKVSDIYNGMAVCKATLGRAKFRELESRLFEIAYASRSKHR